MPNMIDSSASIAVKRTRVVREARQAPVTPMVTAHRIPTRVLNTRSIAMTQLLEKALSEVAKPAPSEQDALATILLEELASERADLSTFDFERVTA